MTRALAERFWSKVAVGADDECWPWLAARVNGYGRFSGTRAEGMRLAHRVAFEFAYGESPPCVRHACDNAACVNPAHLVAGTHGDNMRDMAQRERSRTTRLTAPQALAIRQRRAGGERQVDLATEFGVDPSTVADIAARRTWRHIP